MGKSMRFNEADPEVFVVPRLDDDLIDDLFYQEDEIGEMRHSAFMIECGLEEDPPDGPDVPPIPWKQEDLKPLQSIQHVPLQDPPKRPPRKTRPSRALSMDKGLEDFLDERIPASKPEPRRRIVATKSGSLHGMRSNGLGPNGLRPKKAIPSRSKSFDHSGKSNQQTLSVALARTEKISKRTKPSRGTLSNTKSGSLHEMTKNLEKHKEEGVVRRPSKLVATNSAAGLHGMRQALENDQNRSVKSKDPKLRGSLTMTKSGSKHRSRKQEINGTENKDEKSTASISSDELSISDIDSLSHGSGDVSIETNASFDDEPKPKKETNQEKTPTEILKEIKMDKEKKKKKKPAKGDKEKKSKKEKKTVKKFKVKKANPEDLPPAFRNLSR